MGNELAPEASEGAVLRQPPRDEPPERPYSGVPVVYHFLAGGKRVEDYESEILTRIDDHLKQGRRLLALKKKPLNKHFVAILRDAGDERTGTERRVGVIRFWLHGQHCKPPRPEEAGKRYRWITDPYCLQKVVSERFLSGERIVNMALTYFQKLYWVHKNTTKLPDAVNPVVCPFADRLRFENQETFSNYPKKISAMGMEIFFERQMHRIEEKYVYRVESVPVVLELIHKPPRRKVYGLANVHCDWMAEFNRNLNLGWRLTDILVDFRPPPEKVEHLCMTQFQYAWGNGDNEVTFVTKHPVDTHTLWLWEKPKSRQHVDTPVYEGKIVPFEYEVADKNPLVAWDDVIRDMGRRGWELACFVERAHFREVYEQGRGRFRLTTLLFFQRLLPPPDYDSVVGSASGGGDYVSSPEPGEKTPL